MCGILGGTKKDWRYDQAVAALRHRGPDGALVVPLESLTLGFARLAIIDLRPTAMQPMSSSDKSVWIVFNGEIYGFQNLREDLIRRGHRFHTTSDTEVLLNAYLEWGDGFMDHLDGMFAIGIYDSRVQKLKLFRDRPGIKPLYYYADGKSFAFASELKGLTNLCHDVVFDYDDTAVYDYLTYHYIPEPKTFYKNVYKLLPAHRLTYDISSGTIDSIAPYWRLEPVVHPISLDEACEQLRSLIKESVREQLVADVPLGCFLSGGMDSSTIVAEAVQSKKNIETFSIGFSDEKYSETSYAELVARHYQTHHHSKILSNRRAEELFQSLKTWYDEPFADTSAFPTFLVSEFARQRMTVVLSGDGGDEVFGGYTRFKLFEKLSRLPRNSYPGWRNFISGLRKKLPANSFLYKALCGIEIIGGDDLELYGLIMGEFPYQWRKRCAAHWGLRADYDDYWYFRKHYRKDLPVLTRMQYLDLHTYLPSDILTKVDRVSMAVSLETRVPFLSKKIIEFMFSLPEDVRFYGGQLKGLLRETYKDILPEAVLNRRKMGFVIPFDYFGCSYDQIQQKILREIFDIPLSA